MVAERPESNRRYKLTSANVDSTSQFEKELDCMIEAVVHFEEEERRRRNKIESPNADLVAAGTQI